MVKKVAATKSKSTKVQSKDAPANEFDVYIRMCEDPQKDLCFQVRAGLPVSSLFEIFSTLPVLLTPSFFFDPMPTGFAISTAPGYMTAEGGILFNEDAHKAKWLKKVSSDALIGNVFAPGQLIVPLWHHNLFREYGTQLALLLWLYLDLPEFISPTPGTAPSYYLLWVVDQFITVPETPNDGFFYHWAWQIVFFAFHLVKVSLIYLILWNGLFNPLSGRHSRRQSVPTVEKMVEIGWTGARRCAWSEWSEKYIRTITDRAGGVVQAHKQGLLTRPVGLHLREDEGWNVLKDRKLSEVKVQEDMLDDEGKFVVSERYFAELSKPLKKFLDDPDATPEEKDAMLKEFRECGGFKNSEYMETFFMDQVQYDEREFGGKHIEQIGR